MVRRKSAIWNISTNTAGSARKIQPNPTRACRPGRLNHSFINLFERVRKMKKLITICLVTAFLVMVVFGFPVKANANPIPATGQAQLVNAADAFWQDSGIDIVAGQTLNVTASGTVFFQADWSVPRGYSNPDGAGLYGDGTNWNGDGPQLTSDTILPSTITFSLIGKIGGTTAFGTGTPIPEGVLGKGAGFVGTSYSQQIPTTGRLFFAFNDEINEFWDNSGYFTVTATVVPEPAAPPIANAGPNQVVYAWIDGIADVNLDGSGSYDADGDPLTYKWTWAIDANTYEANGVNPAIELSIGKHIISLIVNDGTFDSEPNEVVITVIAPFEGKLDITPDVLNCRSNQPNIMAMMRLPKGVTKDQIDTNQPFLLYPGEIEANSLLINPQACLGGRINQGTTILASFDKDKLMAAIDANGTFELVVVGQLKTGQYFYGTDDIRVICPGNWPHHKPWCNYKWNRWCQIPFSCQH